MVAQPSAPGAVLALHQLSSGSGLFNTYSLCFSSPFCCRLLPSWPSSFEELTTMEIKPQKIIFSIIPRVDTYSTRSQKWKGVFFQLITYNSVAKCRQECSKFSSNSFTHFQERKKEYIEKLEGKVKILSKQSIQIFSPSTEFVSPLVCSALKTWTNSAKLARLDMSSW